MATNPKDYMAKWRAAHREELRAYYANYRATHREEISVYNAMYVERGGERVRGLRLAANQRCAPAKRSRERLIYMTDDKFKEAKLAKGRALRRKQRQEAIAHYGGACKCCGETTFEFLSFDHINGGGSKHRVERRAPLYHWIRRNGFPDGFQLLCHNCNQSKGAYGYCPHEQGKKELAHARLSV